MEYVGECKLLGGCLHLCVLGFVGGHSCSMWWCGQILVAVRDVVAGGYGASWCFIVVCGLKVATSPTARWLLIVLCKWEKGRGGMLLTWLLSVARHPRMFHSPVVVVGCHVAPASHVK